MSDLGENLFKATGERGLTLVPDWQKAIQEAKGVRARDFFCEVSWDEQAMFFTPKGETVPLRVQAQRYDVESPNYHWFLTVDGRWHKAMRTDFDLVNPPHVPPDVK